MPELACAAKISTKGWHSFEVANDGFADKAVVHLTSVPLPNPMLNGEARHESTKFCLEVVNQIDLYRRTGLLIRKKGEFECVIFS